MQNVDSAKPKWHWALLPAAVVIFARPPKARPACTHSGTRSHSRVTIFERSVQHPPAHVPRAARLHCRRGGLLAYFLPVIEEVLSLRVNPDYFRYLRHKIDRLAQTR